jgi:hypothetical protein
MPSIRGNDPHFHTAFQAQCFHEILMTAAQENVVPQHSVNIGHMECNPTYFSEALGLCDELGIRPIMELSQDYDEELVGQFLATVHFANEVERHIVWMTKTEKLSIKWSDVDALIGFAEHGPGCVFTEDFDNEWFRVHLSIKSRNKEEMDPLYFWNYYVHGQSAGLHPTNDILHRIFRETINPKVGNLDEVHGYLKDLLIMVHENRGKGKKLDVMDYIWNEMWNVTVLKRNACYGPLIMKIVLHAWHLKFPDVALGDPETWVSHKPKRLRIKDHTGPDRTKVKGRRGHSKGKGIIDEEGPSKHVTKSAFEWMARQMMKVFHLNKKIELR